MFETTPVATASRVPEPVRDSVPPLPAQKPATPQAAATPVTPSYANPSMHIDPSLNMLVIEFHNAQGQLTSSTPTPRQLDAYRVSMPASTDNANPSDGVSKS